MPPPPCEGDIQGKNPRVSGEPRFVPLGWIDHGFRLAGTVGGEPWGYSLRELYQMAAGRFEFESMVFGSVLASAFDKDFKAVNPFDRREVLPKTPEEIEAEQRAMAAREEAERRVRVRRFEKLKEAEQRGTQQ